MKLKDLYNKPINRAVNPAVSATKFDPETQRVEIQEYVFTDEILNGLFRILDAIKNNKVYDHVGIWIDGYYGSGKSHFLKYLDYCIKPDTQEEALQRMQDAVKVIDPLDDSHNLNFDAKELTSVAEWLKKATIDTCIFNLETSYDNSTDKKKAFLHVFWNEFNGKRGFNKFNLSLAQHLEKPLQEKGVFDAFKERIAEEGGDWEDDGQAADLIDNELDMVLDIAKELAPSLSIDSIRERIIKRDTVVSIDKFSAELASYLKAKGDDYRLIMLADEVSQFINKERDRYLNLQEIITKLSEKCENKVWIACTAQQDLSEIMEDCHVDDEKDKEGKIKGRFEVKVSLKGTQPEVITQKRILDKKEEVKDDLAELYDKNKGAFDLQFKLPNSYNSYISEDDFIAYYPFVPYQFKLIMQVFNSFLKLGYVAKEVKGNERSIIKVIHATAKAPSNAEAELGKFISFDELYNNMFEEGLQARGQKAVDNAIKMARTYDRDPKFAVRVANVLFMICNISPTDQLLFPATIDNVTTLLVNDVTTPRLTIKNEVEKVVDFLCENNIIRREQSKNSGPDTFSFYSEEEMKLAQLIQSETPRTDTQAEVLKDVFFKYFSVKNKETYMSRSFAIGSTIKQRNFLSNSADIQVEFVLDVDFESVDMLALQNVPNKLLIYLGPQFKENRRLQNAYYTYCKTTQYMSNNQPTASDAETRKEFSKRADETYNQIIVPEFHKILDSCPVVSGQSVMDDSEFANRKGSDRYQFIVQKHLSNIYNKATLVNRSEIPHTTDGLKHAILRPVNPGDYTDFNASLPDAESEVERYLSNQFMEVTVADVVAKFSKAPFGWDGICTLYIINELVRRHNRDYSYANNPNVETSMVATRLVTESNKFTLREAKAISQKVITDFTNVWKDIFGVAGSFSSNDSTQIFRMCREQENAHSLVNMRNGYKEIESEIGAYPFVKPIREAIDLFDSWLTERDQLKFFQAIIDKKTEAHNLIDKCKEIVQFTHDQLPSYRNIRSFVDDNKYNFSFVPMEQQDAVTEILKVKEDEWPIKGLRSYIKLQRELSAALDKVRETLRGEIRTVYAELFDYLEKVAKENNVNPSLLPNRDGVIMTKTASSNILVLRDNKNTDTFYQEQIDRIMRATPKNDDNPSGNNNKDNDKPKPKQPKISQASLSTKTKLPLRNEQDIDQYLSGLREQLLKLLVNNDGVMIIK